MHYTLLMKLSLIGVATLVALVGCAANPAGEDDDAEQSDSNLTQEQRDQRNLTKIRDAVKDVEQEKVTFSSRVKAPSASPGSGARHEHASLYGVDWFQKWPGGVSADHGWENGTEIGKRCMWAAVERFDAIMKEAPPELVEFVAGYDRWSGSFYNWVDDYSGQDESGQGASGDASGARLWAWRTGLSKWISQAAKDGSCYLPTRTMVVDYVKACKEHQAANDGEMQGCQAR